MRETASGKGKEKRNDIYRQQKKDSELAIILMNILELLLYFHASILPRSLEYISHELKVVDGVHNGMASVLASQPVGVW